MYREHSSYPRLQHSFHGGPHIWCTHWLLGPQDLSPKMNMLKNDLVSQWGLVGNVPGLSFAVWS